MQRKVIYIADDGKRFDGEKECEKYDNLLYNVKHVMYGLRYDEKILNEGNAIRHSAFEVEDTFKLMDLCAKAIPDEAKVFQEVKNGTRHISHASYILSEYSSDFPCLNKAMYRFECIDKYNIEYNQPYFVEHRLDFKGVVK